MIGSVVQILNIVLSNNSWFPPPSSSKMCLGYPVKLASFPIKLSLRPHGFCSYCCKLNHPEKFVHLYYSNKYLGEKNVALSLSHAAGSLRAAGVDNTFPTIMYTHGFGTSGLDLFGKSVEEAFINKREDYNVILVDWSELCTVPWYLQAVKNSKMVAKILANFLKFYDSTGELPIAKINLVGVSLGAQMMGFVGKHLKGRISRITALEPSLPLFPLNDESQRITKSDAKYVDVIHTDAGNLGTSISVGHADFYPNGGDLFQPGCEISSLSERRRIEIMMVCGHLRSVEYYVESVRNDRAFPATKCGVTHGGVNEECGFVTDAFMGFPAKESNASGDYYLTTHDRYPYGKSAEEQEPDMRRINLVL